MDQHINEWIDESMNKRKSEGRDEQTQFCPCLYHDSDIKEFHS